MSTAAAVAIHALLDLDTSGEVAETLLFMLTDTSGEEPEGRHYPALALLLPAIEPAELTGVHVAVDLCPVHLCDIEICADDANPECVALTGRGRDPEET